MNYFCQRAVQAGVRYLTDVQAPDGEVPIDAAFSPDMTAGRRLDPCFFGTAAVATTLIGCAPARSIFDRAMRFVAQQRRRGDLWGYYKRGHPQVFPPRDVDDTALATLALTAAGLPLLGSRTLVLGNRDARGRFYTWMTPFRDRRVNLPLVLRDPTQLLYRERYRRFYANSWCEKDDVDAGINANVLAALAPFDGDARIVEWLVEILRDGAEAACDRYYDDGMLIRYFFSRALVQRSPEAGAMLVARAQVEDGAPALHIALAILIRTIWGAEVPDALIARLLATQREDGAWPIASIYCGGRARLADGRFAPAPHDSYRKGSEAVTTAFAVAALDAAARRRG